MSKVRVLHPITRLIVGGAQENTMLTASLLDRERFHVEILSGEETGSEGSLVEEVLARGIPLTVLPDLVRRINPRKDLVAFKKMVSFIRAGRFRIVHTHSSKAGILGRYAARKAGVSLIVHTVHGWSFHDHMVPFWRSVFIWLERWAASFTDALIVVADQDKWKGLGERIGMAAQYHLIRSAIPLEEFDPKKYDRQAVRRELGIPMNATVIGNVGRFSSQKNPIDWVRVASLVSKEYPETYFLLVGDGPLRRAVEGLIYEEGLADRIQITGIRRDAGRMLTAMDIFLITSLWEGLPRVIPQAMHIGLPVVSNQVDGVTDIIQHGVAGFVVPPKDLAQMAVYCGYLVENPGERLEMGKRGHELAAREFDLKRMVLQIEELYENLLRRGS